MVLEDFPRLVSKFKKFVIGLSGGQDSVAVLHLLSSLRELDVSELIKQRQDRIRGFGRFSEAS